MDLEDLKLDYQKTGREESKSMESLSKMKRSGNHPVLKGVKRQLIIESILWMFILIVYYDFFDGHLKSIFWNVLLVISIILLLVHNLLGYIIVKTPINSNNLKDSLKNYLIRIKKYSFVSILSRILAVSIFIGFLTSTAMWNTAKYFMAIGGFILLIVIQYYVLNNVWNKRVKSIENCIELLN